MANKYYDQVKDYYDQDSTNFEDRYWKNKTLQRIRNSFRKVSTNEISNAKRILEIGYGPGLDINYFAEHMPNSTIYGIDISEGMFNWASVQAQEKNLRNVKLGIGSVEHIEEVFPDVKFDHIYVYFGALNTVEDLSIIQHYLKKLLTPNGTMVLTFVNKWYMMAILKPLMKFKFKTSRLRLNKVWGGYSPSVFLESKCYSSKDIERNFNEFDLTYKRGYSILFPAWYENHINTKFPKICNQLWRLDKVLQKTPFWNFGEYSLYVFQQRG
jgi:ubiquinone/menaquinone biosynthesis C-methylase UbiE